MNYQLFQKFKLLRRNTEFNHLKVITIFYINCLPPRKHSEQTIFLLLPLGYCYIAEKEIQA
jgi:hypothetical protein